MTQIPQLIPSKFHKELREKFSFLTHDIDGTERLFFDNSGGSLRLTESIKVKENIDLLPDCPERVHERALELQKIISQTENDILSTMLNAPSGSIITELSASQVMFQIVSTILNGVSGSNVVTSSIEHPSAYDAIEFYCQKLNLEMRIVEPDENGFITPEDVSALVDTNTILVSIIASSNISGNIMDLQNIIKLCKSKKKDVYIISDAVQHLPHGMIDITEIPLDALNFAPYKMMATRGVGFGYVSERVCKLPHHKLIARPDNIWRLGTPTPSIYLSMSVVIQYIQNIGQKLSEKLLTSRESFCQGMKAIANHENALLVHLLEGDSQHKGLRYIKNVEVYLDNAPISHRDLIVAMGIKNWDFETLRERYQSENVTVYERVNTSIYSKRIVESLGLTGAIRVSPLHCHTIDEINKFLNITEKIALGNSE